jgi:hypothetical protein
MPETHFSWMHSVVQLTRYPPFPSLSIALQWPVCMSDSHCVFQEAANLISQRSMNPREMFKQREKGMDTPAATHTTVSPQPGRLLIQYNCLLLICQVYFLIRFLDYSVKCFCHGCFINVPASYLSGLGEISGLSGPCWNMQEEIFIALLCLHQL